MAAWVNEQDSHIPIWIDLEGQYTLAGVVGAIIDQCRTHDVGLAPSVLPLPRWDSGRPADGVREAELQKGADRVLHALGRARYVLALDGLETYLWPPTFHHGQPEETDRAGLDALLSFLVLLLRRANELQGSVVCVSVNPPDRRRGPREGDRSTYAGFVEELKRALHEPGQEPACQFERPPDGLRDLLGCPSRPGGHLDDVLTPVCEDALDPLGQYPDRGRLALLCLSCFRRTRHLVALRTILRPLLRKDEVGRMKDESRQETAEAGSPLLHPSSFLPHPSEDPVDPLLDWYCDQGYLLPVAGGGFWMNGPLRDRVYSRCSEAASKALLDGLARQYDRALARTAALQCLLLALHHGRIARYYEDDNYAMSGDPLAFFESVYHRTSGIRYLTRLVLLRAAAVGHGDWGAAGGVAEHCRNALGGMPDGYLDVRPADLKALLAAPHGPDDALQLRRLREVRGLNHAWLRYRSQIRRAVPHQQIISWCEWLTAHDLPRVVVGTAAPGPREAEVEGAVEQLRETLADVLAESYRERSDFGDSIRNRLEQVERLVGDAVGEGGERLAALVRGPEASDPGRLAELARQTLAGCQPDRLPRLVHCWLDVASCLTSEARLGVDATSSVAPAPPPASRVLAHIRTCLDAGAETPGLAELRLRCLYLQAEAELARVNFWKKGDLYSRSNREAVEEIRDAVAGHVREGLTEVEQRDPTRLSAQHLRFRSLLLTARARLQTLDGREPDFSRVYRDLDLARGGPAPADALYQAAPDLLASEVALAQAHEYLTRGHGLIPEDDSPRAADGPDDLAGVLGRAETKYRLVQDYLHRARSHLLAGRRNVAWWTFFWQIAAQYMSERNLWQLARAYEDHRLGHDPRPGPGGSEAEVFHFLRRIRQGLAVIRQGLEYRLRPSGASPPDDPWLSQVWWEMFGAFAGVASLVDVRRQDGPRRPLDGGAALASIQPGLERFMHHWVWLNQSAGLLEHLKDPVGRCQGLVHELGRRLLAKGAGNGLALRYRVIEAAQEDRIPEGLLGFRPQAAGAAPAHVGPGAPHDPLVRRASTSPVDSPMRT
jgi:hypothetical protein